MCRLLELFPTSTSLMRAHVETGAVKLGLVSDTPDRLASGALILIGQAGICKTCDPPSRLASEASVKRRAEHYSSSFRLLGES